MPLCLIAFHSSERCEWGRDRGKDGERDGWRESVKEREVNVTEKHFVMLKRFPASHFVTTWQSPQHEQQ